MTFKLTANLGDRPCAFEVKPALSASECDIEVVLDDSHMTREQASRLLKSMGARLLEFEWPPRQTITSSEERASD